MNHAISEIDPFRWKVRSSVDRILILLTILHQVFQVLLLDGENTGSETGSIRDARDLVISDQQFKAFLERHKEQKSLVPEDNDTMKDSYLLLDENLWYVVTSVIKALFNFRPLYQLPELPRWGQKTRKVHLESWCRRSFERRWL